MTKYTPEQRRHAFNNAYGMFCAHTYEPEVLVRKVAELAEKLLAYWEEGELPAQTIPQVEVSSSVAQEHS